MIIFLLLFLYSCQKDDVAFAVTPRPTTLTKGLTSFSFLKANNPALPGDLIAIITGNKIAVQLPEHTPLDKLVATFSTGSVKTKLYVDNKEQVSSSTVNNFARPVVYQVVSDEGQAVNMKVEFSTAFPELDASLQGLMQRYNIPGLSVAIVKNEKLVFAKGYGLASKEYNEAVSTSSLFRIASISKPITAVAVLKLVQDGKLSLDEKVFGAAGILNEYGPVPAHSDINRITVKNLLDHKSGWADNPDDPMFSDPSRSHHQIIEDVVLHRPLAYIPGTTYAYSNFGYSVLGRVIEKASGMSYTRFVEEEILHPAGITDMKLAGSTLAERDPNEVTYYQTEWDPYAYNLPRMDAHGGWLATASDLLRLMVRIDRNSNKPDFISPTLLDTNYFGFQNWSHTGSLPGTSTVLTRLNDEYSFAVLANTRDNRAPHLINEELNAILRQVILSKSAWADVDLFDDMIDLSNYAHQAPVQQ